MPNRFFEPLSTRPSQLAKIVADMIDKPTDTDRGKLMPFLAGATEGLGDVASGMTSPFSLAMTAAGMPWASKAGQLTQLGLKAPINAAIDLGPEFVAKGGETAFNAMRGGRMAKEAEAVKDMSLRGGTGRAIQPTSNNEVLKFMQARERAKASVPGNR